MILITIASVLWGTIGLAVGQIYRIAPDAHPLVIGLYRLLIAGPLLLILSRAMVGPAFLSVARPRDRVIMVLIGVVFAAYQILYFSAISRIGVAPAVLINICSSPIFVALLAAVFLHERLTWVTLLVLCGAIAGTALLVGSASVRDGSAPTLAIGGALALGAGFSYAVVAVCGRGIAGRYHPLQPIAVAFTIGAILLLPAAMMQNASMRMSLAVWLLIIYVAVVPTTLSYALYFQGLKSTSATVAAILSLLEPLGSTLMAVAFLDERLSARAMLGGAILLASVAILYIAGSRKIAETEVATPVE